MNNTRNGEKPYDTYQDSEVKNRIKVRKLSRSNSLVDKTLFSQSMERSGMSSHQKSAIMDIVKNRSVERGLDQFQRRST